MMKENFHFVKKNINILSTGIDFYMLGIQVFMVLSLLITFKLGRQKIKAIDFDD